MAAGSGSLLRGFLSLFFLLFIHIGHASCCFSPGPASRQREEDGAADAASADGVVAGGRGGGKRRKISPLAFSPAASSSAAAADDRVIRDRRRHASSLATSLRFYIHRIFASAAGAKNGAVVAGREAEEEGEAVTTTTVSSPQAQSLAPQPSASLVLSTPSSPCAASPPFMSSPLSSRSLGAPSSSPPQKASRRSSSRSFAARGDVLFPCKVCGEVLTRPQQLELHHATNHSLSELSHLDSSTNIIRMIFLAGWKSGAGGDAPAAVVRRVLRIHHNPRALARFEEYRDLVRARAARRCVEAAGAGVAEEERCVADGNERLRFHCSTMLCPQLGAGGGACRSPYCCVCSTLRHGFAGKQADVDGVATYASAWAAHAALPDDVEREFAFLQVRRAMLVCRVVAGRVGRGDADDKVEYDSVVPVRAGGVSDDVELLVFNPRAVLPCFVIIYSCS